MLLSWPVLAASALQPENSGGYLHTKPEPLATFAAA